MADLCDDNRFELIEKHKKELIEATNIETAPDEMAVLDNILFRFWQMGWLDKLELPSVQPELSDEEKRLYKKLRSYHNGSYAKLLDKMMASVQPEIVRCKDCLMHGVCRFEHGLGLNGYCSQAERRADETD